MGLRIRIEFHQAQWEDTTRGGSLRFAGRPKQAASELGGRCGKKAAMWSRRPAVTVGRRDWAAESLQSPNGRDDR
ncbi:hypothetical protein VTN02DRAFT_4296 [Thermoascus thermophilus]